MELASVEVRESIKNSSGSSISLSLSGSSSCCDSAKKTEPDADGNPWRETEACDNPAAVMSLAPPNEQERMVSLRRDVTAGEAPTAESGLGLLNAKRVFSNGSLINHSEFRTHNMSGLSN